MMGLGDVASILVPALKLIREQHPGATTDVLTYEAGSQLMELMPEVNKVLAVSREQWPDDLGPAIQSFINIAEVVAVQQYDLIINLDTWFMPCFLARLMQDSGLPVEGNYLNQPVEAFFNELNNNTLTQNYFSEPQRYLDSSFPHMQDWLLPWWEKYSDAGGYPEFYLRHCCGFDGELDVALPIAADETFKQAAGGKPIIALSMSGSKPSKQYRQREQLVQLLEQAGYYVWGQFDGSLPMEVTLGRLKVTDLLITVPTSTQWLARLVGCPSLMISGPLPPVVLDAEIVVDRVVKCQYCYQTTCPENIDFACMNVAPQHLMDKVRQYFATQDSGN